MAGAFTSILSKIGHGDYGSVTAAMPAFSGKL
jgi:hypothetical protein